MATQHFFMTELTPTEHKERATLFRRVVAFRMPEIDGHAPIIVCFRVRHDETVEQAFAGQVDRYVTEMQVLMEAACHNYSEELAGRAESWGRLTAQVFENAFANNYVNITALVPPTDTEFTATERDEGDSCAGFFVDAGTEFVGTADEKDFPEDWAPEWLQILLVADPVAPAGKRQKTVF